MTRILSLAALLSLGSALAVAGCARSEEASLVPPDSNQGYNQIGRVGLPEDDDREPAIGQWQPSLQANVQALEFGPMGTEPLFSLLCNGSRSVFLQRHGGVAAGQVPAMQVSRGEVSERLAVTAAGTGAVPLLRAEVPLQSPLAAAIAAQGDNLLVGLDDAAPLVLPPSPLVGDYLRSCASAQPLPMTGAAPSAPPAGNGAMPAPAPVAPSANQAAPAPAADGARPKG